MNDQITAPGVPAAGLRPWHILALVAVLLAASASFLSSKEQYPEKLVRIETERTLPSFASQLNGESPELNLLFLNYAPDPQLWMSAALALLNHDDVAREVLLDYGMVPAFQEGLLRFGGNAVLPVHYFHKHDIQTLRARNWVSARVEQLKGQFSDAEVDSVQALTPFRRGLVAVALLNEQGHGMLDQFEIDSGGNVIWLQGERVVSAIGDFFTGGLRDLEGQWRRGDDVGAGDLAWAGLDLLVMAGSIKLLRAGKAASMTRSGRGVGQGRAIVGARFGSLAPMAKVSAVLGTGYIMIRHPALLSAVGASVATWLGWPEWLGQFLIWFLVLLPLLFVFRFVVFKTLWACVRWVRNRSRHRSGHAMTAAH